MKPDATHRRSRGSRAAAWLAVGLLIPGMILADVKTKSPDDKKSKKSQESVPEARDGSAKFVSGQPSKVELAASVGTLRPVEFIVRTPPEHGILSAVSGHPRETNKGILTYTHFGGDRPLVDRFTFACRVDGGPVSASAVITLKGQRFEPKLELVDYIPVDKVFLGGEASVRFALKNTGAAAFASDMTWEAPWQGPPRIELKAGETGQYDVLFRPTQAGVYRLEKLLQPGVNDSKLPLYGQCVRSLTVTPGRLALALTSSGAREGELLLVNGRPEPLRVEVKPVGRLQGGGAFEVPGSARARVVLALPPQDVGAFRGEVVVGSTQGGETITVEAAAKPADLRVVSPGGLQVDLGGVPQGKEGRGEILIRNYGGTTAVVQAQTRAPLTAQPYGQAVRLEPGGQAAFDVVMKGDQPGQLQGELSFSGDIGAPRIQVRMQVLEADSTPTPPVAPVLLRPAGKGAPQPPVFTDVAPVRTPAQQMLMAFLAASGMPTPKERINPHLERVTEVFLQERGAHTIKISWKKPKVAPAGWVLEAASMAQVSEGATFVKFWRPLKNWKLVEGPPENVTVRLDSLPAAAQIELRIMGVDRDDKISEPSPGFLINTANAWKMPSWVWQLLVILGLGAAGFGLYRVRESRLQRSTDEEVVEKDADVFLPMIRAMKEHSLSHDSKLQPSEPGKA